ncbi:MAG: helix-turn-helix domain-containing protein [Clostridia bacterium]|nr:helix-turn-helix domain-containing protein [Clostridia bacterium]
MPKQRIIGKIEPVQKKWLSASEAKSYLDCSDDFLRNLRDNALISFSRFGRNMFWYDLASIDRFILKNKVV